MTCPEELAAYYGSPQVRARIAEYCGGVAVAPASFAAWAMAGYGGRRGLHEPDGAPVAVGSAGWATLLDEGADVCRSLADRGGTLLQLDLDYVNPTDRAEPYRDPAGCFARMEPAYEAVQAVFACYGIRPFVLMTGRGYHFTLRAASESRFHASLVEIGQPPASLRERYRAFTAPGRAPAMGRAHEGAGRLLEHLAHEALRRLAGRSPVPVTLADVAPPGLGPFVCLDLTAYADPLFERYARCAFSGNQKSAVTAAAPERPFTVNLPRDAGEGLAGLLRDREDVTRAAERARHVPARIPDAADGRAWVEDYRGSRLARFHGRFEAGPELPPEACPCAYDSLDLGALPACARLPLEDPNPALLTPVYLRTVALTLCGLGWHPRSAAAIVRSRYEKDLGWGGMWQRYDPAARAAFYVRVICGAFADGLEDAASFTCESQALRGVCRGGCGWDLSRLLPDAALAQLASAGRGREEKA